MTPYYKDHLVTIYHGRCEDIIPKLSNINLIITSPPYADARNSTYGGISPDKYNDWFLPLTLELYKILNNNGSFILNIKEKAINGKKHPYVLELILEMQKKYEWIDEYIWHKKSAYPGKWPNRFRDAWERLLHFAISTNFDMYQDAVMIQAKESSINRVKNLTLEKDFKRTAPKSGSGMDKKRSNFIGRELVYPDNVLYLASETSQGNHSAPFPEAIPNFFIRLLTIEDDVVLDPFLGSGTTCVQAKKLGRYSIGIEQKLEYCRLAADRCGELLL